MLKMIYTHLSLPIFNNLSLNQVQCSEIDVHWSRVKPMTSLGDMLLFCWQFMEQEGGSDLLQFWLATDNFQQHLLSCEGEYDGMQAQSDAVVIYDKYVL